MTLAGQRLRLPVQRHRHRLGPRDDVVVGEHDATPLDDHARPRALHEACHAAGAPEAARVDRDDSRQHGRQDGLDVARPDVHGRRRKVLPDNGLRGAAREHRDEATAGEGADECGDDGDSEPPGQGARRMFRYFRSRSLLEAPPLGPLGLRPLCAGPDGLVVLRRAIRGRTVEGRAVRRRPVEGPGRALGLGFRRGFGGWRGRGSVLLFGALAVLAVGLAAWHHAHNVPGVNLRYGSRHSCEQDLRQKTLGFAANVSFCVTMRRRTRHNGVVDTSWMGRGKCREVPPDTFFPSDGVGVEVARRICADCPVKEPCLEYAMANHIDHGVWGGTSERERRRIARHRRLLATRPN